MKEPSGRRWLVGAVGLFLVLLVAWVVAAVRISASAAAPANLASNLRSRLTANYAPDPAGSTVHSLRLSIFEQVLQDLGMTGDQAESRSREIQEQLQGPVPTATALDFEGAPPFTATPTATPTPTETPTPPPTSTRTPRPTATVTKTAVPKPTHTPVGSLDTKDPQICCIDLNPGPTGSLASCTIQVTDMEVFDDAFSSGINLSEVYIKYEKAGMGNWQYTLLNKTSGDFTGGPGSAWSGHFDGSFTLRGLAAGDSINVVGKVKDNAGHYGYHSGGSYTLATDCP